MKHYLTSFFYAATGEGVTIKLGLFHAEDEKEARAKYVKYFHGETVSENTEKFIDMGLEIIELNDKNIKEVMYNHCSRVLSEEFIIQMIHDYKYWIDMQFNFYINRS